MKGNTTEELRTPDEKYVFVAPSIGRRLVQIGLLFTALAMIWSSYELMSTGGTEMLALTVGAAILIVAQWTILQAWIPQRIVIEKSVITIIKKTGRTQYDLVDPGVEVRVRDGAIALAHYLQPWSVVYARDVSWHEFIDVLMHYQSRADVNAELRDARFRS